MAENKIPQEQQEPAPKKKSIKTLKIKMLRAALDLTEAHVAKRDETIKKLEHDVKILELTVNIHRATNKIHENTTSSMQSWLERLDTQSVKLLQFIPLETIFKDQQAKEQYETLVKKLDREGAVNFMLQFNVLGCISKDLAFDYFDTKYAICKNCQQNKVTQPSIQPCTDGEIRCDNCCRENCSGPTPEETKQVEQPKSE